MPMPTVRRPVLLALACLAAGLPLAACGEEIAPADELEAKIKPEYEKQAKLKLPELECEDADAEQGARVTCTGRNASGVDLTIGGEITSVDDDRFSFSWEVDKALAPGTLYADAARVQIEQQVGEKVKSLTCPDRIEVDEGQKVECEIEAPDGTKAGVTLTLTDRDGGFEYQVDAAPAN